MDIWKKLTGELIDIVQWLDNSRDTLVYRFERQNNEIKNGAKLIVRESQAAVFINEGQIADIFKLAGTFDLHTENLPILSTLQGWKYGFESPFKAEVYFVNTRQFTDCKWGTANPIMLRDPEFGVVRLRAFGSYAFRVADPAMFLKQIVGTNPKFDVDGISDQIRNFIVSQFTNAIGESKIPALDLAANYLEVAKALREKLSALVADYGLEITTFLIENISLPPEVEKVLDQRTSMGIVGDVNKYMQFNAAQAMGNPASGAGGTMGQTLGMGAGFAMGQQMAAAMAAPTAAASTLGGAALQSSAPPLPGAIQFYLALDGKQAGPFDAAALSQLATQGKLTAQTLAWKHGMGQWTAASQLPELAAALANAAAKPPPLPN